MSSYCNADLVKTMSQVKYTQLEYASDEEFKTAITNTFIPMAQVIIDSFCEHNFQNNKDATLTLDGNGKKVLFIQNPYVPLISVTEVLIDDVNVTSDVKVYKTFLRYNNGVFTKNVSNGQNVSLKFDYGYTSVPDDIKFVCAEVCALMLNEQVRKKLMPDLMMQAMQSDGVGGGLLQNPRVLTPDLKSILNKYRFVTPR